MAVAEGPHFGLMAIRGLGFCIDAWGGGPLLIRDGKRRWWFEFSDRFGPLWLRATDKEPAARQPVREDDPFWKPFNAWLRAGKKCRAVRNKRGLVEFWVCHWPKGQEEGE